MKNRWHILYFAIVVAYLNFLDGALSAYGLQLNVMEEGNPMMLILWEKSPYLFVGGKILLSVCIVLVSIHIYHHSKVRFQQIFRYVLMGLTVMYISISILHVTWLQLI